MKQDNLKTEEKSEEGETNIHENVRKEQKLRKQVKL
jgi:hypothetical protein